MPRLHGIGFQQSVSHMEPLFTAVVVLSATIAILGMGRIASCRPFPISNLGTINFQAKYQLLLLGVAFFILFVIAKFDSANFSNFVAIGHVNAPAQDVAWLGIRGESWGSLGPSVLFFITLGTSAFVYLQFRKSAARLKHLVAYLPWVLLFSATNSLSEEIIYRLGVIVPLFGKLDTEHIVLISAIAFGLPHLKGMPNGLVGVAMAGFLGWLLAKSVVETNGIFWAWFIHFIQDVVIFTGFVLSGLANTAVKRDAPQGRASYLKR